MKKWKLLLVGVVGLTGAMLLQGCEVRPVVVARAHPCYRCHWHHWHRGGCWVNRWGVMHCRG